MLDLTTAFQTAPYQIKLFDGSILNLKRPTQALYQSLMDVLPMVSDGDDKMKALPVMMDIFTRILNRNEEGKHFAQDEISDEYDIMIVTYVIRDYFEYWNKEMTEQVNFQSAQ